MSGWKLFEAIGIELEYMIVDRQSLEILPIADKVLAAVAGEVVGEAELGEIAWSNELVLHVLELKTNGPVASLEGVTALFSDHVARANDILAGHGACLLPTAAHPWMDPLTQTRLWPHECGPIYQAYNRIFDCRGHGWSNLQSTHINLPFASDEEFCQLHAAIRLLLPVMPALAASSPIIGGQVDSYLDSRMRFYCGNSARIPEVSGMVIPERAFSAKEYDEQIFQPMYAAIRPHDPEGLLAHEFLNARGAIARFDRGAIEIRVLDIQECPRADLAVVGLIVAALKALVAAKGARLATQMAVPEAELAAIFQAVICDGDQARIADPAYLELFGLGTAPMRAGEFWQRLAENWQLTAGYEPALQKGMQQLLENGPLARRILAAVGPMPDRASLHRVYGELAECLAEGRLFGVPD